MAFDATLTLDDASGDATTYVQLPPQTGEASRRINSATTSTEPGLMVIRHNSANQKGVVVDRRSLAFTQTKLSSNNGPVTGAVSINFTQPRDTVITDAMMLDLLSVAVDFITSGGFGDSGIAASTNFDKFNRGEA